MGMIINPYLVQPSSAYGTLTTAWIAATGETDLTILGALNTLESDLTTYGLTSKIKALYPMVGGTAAKHKFNFMDARDLDAAYRLTFNGGWTHASTGALPNGTNAYADAYITNSAMSYTSIHLSVYSRTNNLDGIAIGNTTNQYCLIYPRQTGDIFYAGINAPVYMSATVTDSRGHFLATRRGNTDSEGYRNGVSIATSTAAMANDNTTMYLGAAFRQGVGAVGYDDRELALASIGDGLTDTEAANFYTAVQTFQTTLGRQVGVPIVSDADAQAFLNAAVITDTTQASAVNQLVTDLKGYSIWTKMKALYPFVGGTSTTHSYNLKNTAQYQITWNGGGTHSSTGYLPNGINAYGDTGFKQVSNFTSTSNASMGTYLRTDSSTQGVDMGAGVTNTGADGMLIYSSFAGTTYYGCALGSSLIGSGDSNSDSRGFYAVVRDSGVHTQHKRGNVTINTSETEAVGTISDVNLYIGAGNSTAQYPANVYSDRETAFAFIGDTLTQTEIDNFYTAVQAFQTTLSRNV